MFHIIHILYKTYMNNYLEHMAIQVPQNYWYRILLHYQNLLSEKFMYAHMTPRVQYEMQAYFDHCVAIAKQRETHLAWQVPLRLVFEPHKASVIVEAADPTSVELL
jgi:hypothetical protein